MNNYEDPFVSVMPPSDGVGGYAPGDPAWMHPAPPTDPWMQIANAYGLGAPPAQGMPASLPGVQVGAPPQVSTNMNDFTGFMNQINGQIGGAYGYQTPQANASLIDQSRIPQPNAQQFGTSAELQRLLSGQGYTQEMLTRMRATATEQPAQAGLQQMSQMRRMLGEAGVHGGAEVALRGEVARQTGQAQGQALRDVDLQNANTGMENQRFGVGQQTSIGLSNMQAANQIALQNSQMLFQALRDNQSAQNSTNQLNTQMQGQQRLAGANAQSNFLGQQGAQGQQQRNDNTNANANRQWDASKMQTGLDWDRQTRQWDELNKRFGQSQNILGNWSAQ